MQNPAPAQTQIPLCDPYVWEDPRYLFRFPSVFASQRGTCASESVNFVVFVYIAATLAGLAISSFTQFKGGIVYSFLLATLLLIPTFLKLRKLEGFRINFAGSEDVHTDDDDPDLLLKQAAATSGSVQEGFVVPAPVPPFNAIGIPGASAANPFNNILLNELPISPVPSPERPEAADVTTTSTKIALDDFFRVQWYSDPTDVFGKAQSQRQFVTQPVTTIPNDQGSYQTWLYKIPGKTCKEGNAKACYGGTEGATIPWLNNP